MVCFNGYDEMQNAKTMAEKLLVVDLSTSTYKGRENINVALKNMTPMLANYNIFAICLWTERQIAFCVNAVFFKLFKVTIRACNNHCSM